MKRKAWRRARTKSQAARAKGAFQPLRLSLGKKIGFAFLATVLFFVGIEGVLVLFGVKPLSYDEDPYVGFASNNPLFVEETRPDGRIEMVTAAGKRRWFNEQRFLREKPSGTYRIFSLGGSTTYGRPYDDVASFSGWLRELLPVADPSRDWEVVNAGGISYASYRVAVVMEALAQYEPDLFIIYSGHNEFLERRTYASIVEAPRVLTGLGAMTSRTRIFAAMKALVSKPPIERDGAVLRSEVDPLLEHSVGPSDYTRDDPQRERTIDHYRFNLNRMIDIARSANAGVVLVTPASNLRNCSPFKSEHLADLDSAELDRFEALHLKAETARTAGDLAGALSALDDAASIDDRYAELHYRRGLLLYELERYEEARLALERAVDEDICPLRALTSMQRIVREVGAQREVPLVDFAHIMEEQAEHGIPGSRYFLDHVHLTVEGYGLMALRLIEALERHNVVRTGNAWGQEVIQSVRLEVEGRIDKEAEGVAMRNLAKVFAWAGKLEEAERMASRAGQILGQDAESLYTIGLSAAERGELEAAIDAYSRALDIEPGFAKAHNSLGVALTATGDIDAATHHFRKALEARSDFAEAHYNLANALDSQGKLDEAIHHFRRALEREPHFADASNNLGIALATQGRLDEAIRAFRNAIRLRPDPETENNLAMALMSQRRIDEAIGHFRNAIDGERDFVEAHYNLGNALSLSGQIDQALVHLGRAARLSPDWPAPSSRLAWILATRSDGQAGDTSRAIQLAERAATLTQYRDASIMDTLAAAYAADGQFDRAVEVAQEGLALASAAAGRKLADAIRGRLELYRQRKPYRKAP